MDFPPPVSSLLGHFPPPPAFYRVSQRRRYLMRLLLPKNNFEHLFCGHLGRKECPNISAHQKETSETWALNLVPPPTKVVVLKGPARGPEKTEAPSQQTTPPAQARDQLHWSKGGGTQRNGCWSVSKQNMNIFKHELQNGSHGGLSK